MTKLRNRLLVTLVLAAVSLAALGIGVASARSPQRRNPSLSGTAATSRPGVGRFSGEPDPNMGGAPTPPKVEKTALSPSNPGLWVAQLWMQWRVQGPSAQHNSRR